MEDLYFCRLYFLRERKCTVQDVLISMLGM